MKRWVSVVAAALVMIGAARAEAAVIFLDTTPLQGLGGTWYLDFQLADGDGVANNSVDIEVLDLGGGALLPGETFAGGGAGSFPSYSLADSDVFNQVLVPFTAGSFVRLDLTFTQNLAGFFPDTFTWAVLDDTFTSIVTDPNSLGAGLVILLDGFGTIEREAADARYDAIIPVIERAVPEPSVGALLLIALAGGRALRRRVAR